MGHIRWYEARHEIANFALPLIKQYQISRSGYPGVMHNLVGASDKLAEQRWAEILKDIETGLQTIVDDELLNEEDRVILQQQLELFGKWFYHLWD